ncbi:hypothetical protein MASR2M29_03240 [Spirochaetota bacterium]
MKPAINYKISGLWLKLVASLGAMVLLSSLLSIVVVRISIDSNFRRLLNQSDRQMARLIADSAEEFLSQGGSMEDFAQSMGIGKTGSMPMRRGNMGRLSPRLISPGLNSIVLNSLALTDNQGNVIFHSMDTAQSRSIRKLLPKNGEAITHEKHSVAFVFSGTMINPILGPLQERFLKNTTRAVLISALLGLFIALVTGSFLFSNIMKPLEILKQASAEVAKGKLHIQLPTRRNDELGSIMESFNSMVYALKASEEWKRHIIADLAHELRTPISLIQARLEMMMDGIYPLEEAQLKTLHENASLLAKLVKELQELYSVESGSILLAMTKLDLGDLCLSIAKAFEPGCLAKGISLDSKSCEQGKFFINADKSRMIQLINNLIQNAVNASQSNSTITLELENKSSPGNKEQKIQLKILDEGKGIPQKDRDKIFERFFRLEAARERSSGGSGLGLAISKEIVKLHQGSIWVEDNPKGQGSMFVIELPGLL